MIQERINSLANGVTGLSLLYTQTPEFKVKNALKENANYRKNLNTERKRVLNERVDLQNKIKELEDKTSKDSNLSKEERGSYEKEIGDLKEKLTKTGSDIFPLNQQYLELRKEAHKLKGNLGAYWSQKKIDKTEGRFIDLSDELLTHDNSLKLAAELSAKQDKTIKEANRMTEKQMDQEREEVQTDIKDRINKKINAAEAAKQASYQSLNKKTEVANNSNEIVKAFQRTRIY